MSQSFNADELRITKAQLISKLELIVRRWEKDPNISNMVIKRFKLDLFFLRHFLKEEHLPLYWKNFVELFDELRSYNARKSDKVLAKLNPMAEAALEKKFLHVPGVNSEYDSIKILAEAKRRVSLGAMKDA